jgi:hypothetical protein
VTKPSRSQKKQLQSQRQSAILVVVCLSLVTSRYQHFSLLRAPAAHAVTLPAAGATSSTLCGEMSCVQPGQSSHLCCTQ